MGAGPGMVAGSGTIVGTAMQETITGSSTDDLITANGGFDLINTGAGNDVVVLNSIDIAYDLNQVTAISDFADGFDRIGIGQGMSINDFTAIQGTGAFATDTAILYRGSGYLCVLQNTNAANISSADFVLTEPVTVSGTPAGEFLLGGIADDEIFGRGGDDSISGDLGNDVIVGGNGDDGLAGGTGSDTFVYNAASHAQVGGFESITDFDATDDNEDIFLNGLLQGAFQFIGDNPFVASGNTQANFDAASEMLGIDLDGDTFADMEILLSNVDVNDLDDADFTVTAVAV
jgi:Ca2+-binding RTX toxin-like protein